MNLGGNGKMDWFFDQYVYGTQLPNYKLESAVGNGENGVFNVSLKITQSNVDDNFRMPVNVYLELADGRVTRLGAVPMKGNYTFQQVIPLSGLKDAPKRAFINYYYDVLGTGY
ncbi:MAG TPA: hypothetical protein VN577_13690 [Terriglobales bacterium]|nr:hypothetical protein [Terriglobales bacterium]